MAAHVALLFCAPCTEFALCTLHPALCFAHPVPCTLLLCTLRSELPCALCTMHPVALSCHVHSVQCILYTPSPFRPEFASFLLPACACGCNGAGSCVRALKYGHWSPRAELIDQVGLSRVPHITGHPSDLHSFDGSSNQHILEYSSDVDDGSIHAGCKPRVKQ
jgi:hypothetical protein